MGRTRSRATSRSRARESSSPRRSSSRSARSSASRRRERGLHLRGPTGAAPSSEWVCFLVDNRSGSVKMEDFPTSRSPDPARPDARDPRRRRCTPLGRRGPEGDDATRGQRRPPRLRLTRDSTPPTFTRHTHSQLSPSGAPQRCGPLTGARASPTLCHTLRTKHLSKCAELCGRSPPGVAPHRPQWQHRPHGSGRECHPPPRAAPDDYRPRAAPSDRLCPKPNRPSDAIPVAILCAAAAPAPLITLPWLRLPGAPSLATPPPPPPASTATAPIHTQPIPPSPQARAATANAGRRVPPPGRSVGGERGGHGGVDGGEAPRSRRGGC